MNEQSYIQLHSVCISRSLAHFICNHYDNNILFILSLNRNFYLWAANLKFLTKFLILQRIPSGLPMMHMSSEKLKRFFCPLFLVSIWSLLESSLAAPRQASAASKLSSVPVVPEPMLHKKSQVGGDVRICPLSRKRNYLNRFFKRHMKANPLWWPMSVKPMKQLPARKSRLPQSTGCWLATDGARCIQIVQWSKVRCYRHECFAQISPFWLSTHPCEFRLGDSLSNPSRFRSCRSYLCTSGGYG